MLENNLRQLLGSFSGLDVLIDKNQIPVGIENVVDYLGGPHHKLFLGHAIAVSCDAHEAPPADTAEIFQQVLSQGHAEVRTKRGVQAQEKAGTPGTAGAEVQIEVQPLLEGLTDYEFIKRVQV